MNKDLNPVYAYPGPDGTLYRHKAAACAAYLRQIVGFNLQHAEAEKIVRHRREVIRLLQLMDQGDLNDGV